MEKDTEKLFSLHQLEKPRGDFFYAKTEIAEIAPRPSALTFEILQKLYQKNGPIDRVYKKYGIKYSDTNFLKIFGNELYVNKEKEIKSLLPAYSFFRTKNQEARLVTGPKIFLTLRNIFFLNLINPSRYKDLFVALKKKLKQKDQGADYFEKLNNFLQDYEIIFEINLLAQTVTERVKKILQKEEISLVEIIASQSFFVKRDAFLLRPPSNLQGNSIELSDLSKFVSGENMSDKISQKFLDWWQKKSQTKKVFWRKRLRELIILNRLREYGRWLGVRHIGSLRQILFEQAQKSGFEKKELIFFAQEEEIVNDKIDEKICEARKEKHEHLKSLSLPAVISSFILPHKNRTEIVSSGKTRGKLLDYKTLKESKNQDEKIILYTPVMSSDLLVYLNRINGLVSGSGSLLSHLAIVAREKNIPVIIGVNLEAHDLEVGDFVELDAQSGVMQKIKL